MAIHCDCVAPVGTGSSIEYLSSNGSGIPLGSEIPKGIVQQRDSS